MKAKMNLLITLFLCICVCACGKQARENDGNVFPGVNPDKIATGDMPTKAEGGTPSWNVTRLGLNASYEVATIRGDRIYGCSYVTGGLLVSTCDAQTGELLESHQIPGVTEIQNITVDDQNQICLFGTNDKGNAFWQVAKDGEVKMLEDVEVEELGKFPVCKGFYADSKGFFYLWYGMLVPYAEVYGGEFDGSYTDLDRIYVKDRDMNTVCYEQVPDSSFNKLISLMFDEEGSPVMLARDEDGYYTRRVRTEEREAYGQRRIEGVELYELEAGGNAAMTSEGLLFTRDGAVHLYHLEEGWDEKLMELAAGGIFEEDVVCLDMRGGVLEIIDNYRGSEKSEYGRFERGERLGQVTVTLGVMELTPGMRDLVASFNRSQSRIQVKPVTYVEGYDYDAGYERLKLDVIQGKAPDVFSTDGMEYDVLANAGALMDLYGFLDQDPELGREDLVSSVLKAYETKGCLYALAPNFYVFTMWGGESVVKGRRGVTMEELMQILKENGGDVNSIYGFSADESVIRTLCALGMDEFICWEEGTCDFTGEAFREVLKFAGEWKGKQFDSLFRAIRSGELLMTLMNVSSVEDYCLWSEMYGEKIQYLGYPTASGTGSAVYMGEELAVSAKTERAGEAWEFLKYFLLRGYEFTGTGFPLVRDQFEAYLAKALEEEMVMDETGHFVRMAKRSYRERDVAESAIVIYKAEPGDVEAVREMIEGATGKYGYVNEIMTIIDEEAESYFQNQKTLDQVTHNIQNRVQLYLKENR